jgi:hypothetical protein
VDNFGDFNFIGVIIVIASEALHTRKAKPYGCAAIVTSQAHDLGSGCDILYCHMGVQDYYFDQDKIIP